MTGKMVGEQNKLANIFNRRADGRTAQTKKR